jgi:hypothetical protein
MDTATDTHMEAPPDATPNSPAQLVRLATSTEAAALKFPESAYVGVAAKFAELQSREYESPKEFFYMDLLALIGTLISGRVRVDVDTGAQPRLYVLKIAPSAWQRKSSSTRAAQKFLFAALEGMKSKIVLDEESVVSGVGSAEGLAQVLSPREGPFGTETTRRTVLVFDEFRRFESKARIEGSALRPAVNELYESNQYSNVVRDRSIHVVDGHLGFLSNTTVENFQNLLDPNESKDIGFMNRFFLIVGNTTRRVPRPKAPEKTKIEPIQRELAEYFAGLPHLTVTGKSSEEHLIPFTEAAETKWDDWYVNLDQDETTARLDTIGLRLLGLLAFTSGKNTIDSELVKAVLDILEYQRQVRTLYKPNEGSNPVAKMEESIRRQLKARGPLKDRDLKRHTNASRPGIVVYQRAVNSLKDAKEIGMDQREKKYFLIGNNRISS